MKTNGESDKYIHIVFELEQDQHGWPPVGAERLWAVKVADSEYRIENIPFYVRGVRYGDTVMATERETDGPLFFTKVLKESGHCTVGVLMQNNGEALENNLKIVLRANGADIESIRPGFFAIDIPPYAKLQEIVAHLQSGEARNEWAFEEGKITSI